MIEHFSFVKWIYLSKIPIHALIVLDKNNYMYLMKIVKDFICVIIYIKFLLFL